MSVQFAGPSLDSRNRARVTIDSAGTDFERNDLVIITSGKADKNEAAATAGLAVALEKSNDPSYEGTKTEADVALLQGVLVKVPFSSSSTGTLAQDDIGKEFALDATGQAIDIDTVASPVFQVTGFADGTAIGDDTGEVWGYFLDSACFGS